MMRLLLLLALFICITSCRHAAVASAPTRVEENPARQWGPCVQIGKHEVCLLAQLRRLD